MNIVKRLLLAATAAFAINANAYVGNYTEGSFTYNSGTQDFVGDLFNFTLDTTTNLRNTIEFNAGNTGTGLFGVGLYNALDNSLIANYFLTGGASATTSRSFNNIAAGSYYYGVVGLFAPAGQYTFHSKATAAVPEPATMLMALLGVGALGFAVRRNKAKSGV